MGENNTYIRIEDMMNSTAKNIVKEMRASGIFTTVELEESMADDWYNVAALSSLDIVTVVCMPDEIQILACNKNEDLMILHLGLHRMDYVKIEVM